MISRTGASVQSKLGMLIFGNYGTWKSSMALEFLKWKTVDGKPYRVLYIDNENGSIDDYVDSYQEQGIDIKNLYIAYTQSLTETLDCLQTVIDNKPFYYYDDNGNETDEKVLDADGEVFVPDAIVVDGAYVLNLSTKQKIIEFSKKRAKVRAEDNKLVGDAKMVKMEGAGIEIKDYQTINFEGHNLIMTLIATGKDYVITTREKKETEQKEDNKGQMNSVWTGKYIADGFKGLGHNVRVVLRNYIDEFGVVHATVMNKDRTNIHQQGDDIENPTLMDWYELVIRNKDRKIFRHKNTLQDSVNKDVVDYEHKLVGKGKITDKEKEKLNIQDKEKPEDIIKEITIFLNNVPQAKKSKLKDIIKKKKLTTKYADIKDVKELKEYLKILQDNI